MHLEFTLIFTTNFVCSLDIRASRESFPIEVRRPVITIPGGIADAARQVNIVSGSLFGIGFVTEVCSGQSLLLESQFKHLSGLFYQHLEKIIICDNKLTAWMLPFGGCFSQAQSRKNLDFTRRSLVI